MSDLVIKDLFETRLNANSGGVDVAFENVPYSPTNGRPYQMVSFMPAQTEDPCKDAGYRRLSGVVQVLLCYPLKAGSQPALTRAAALVAAFPRGLSLSKDNVTLKLLRSSYVGRGRAGAAFYELPVTVPYVAEVFD